MASYPQPGETFGSYTILDRIGQGGMGVVYRAVQTPLNRHVALKVLLPHHAEVPEFRERFTREAGILATVENPHIVAIHDFGEINGCLFIAAQLVPGGDLATLLQQRGAMPVPVALSVIAQLASALAAAHEARVVHRDVKPTNVLMGERDGQPHAYLSDFGIARAGDEGMTQTGMVVGTYAYLAPERINGADATPATDIYALGCLLVALVSGHAPYQGTDMHVAQQHISAPIPQWDPTSWQLDRLNQVVRRSMAKDPSDRYPTAAAMRQEVLEAIAGPHASPAAAAQVAPTVVRPPTSETAQLPSAFPTSHPVGLQTSERPRRTGLMLAIASLALVLLATIGVGGVLLTGSDDTPADSTPTSGRTGQAATPRTSSQPTRDPSPSASAQAGRQLCVDGRAIPTTEECGEPQGQGGLDFVFPGIPSRTSCIRSDQASLGPVQRSAITAYRQCDQSLVAGEQVRVTYARYVDYETGARYLAGLFGSGTTDTGNAVEQYSYRQLPNGGYEIARMYSVDEPHPFSVSVACGNDLSKCERAITLIAFAPSDRFDG